MYAKDIEEDLRTLTELGLAEKLTEFKKELQTRLSGVKDEAGGDNMLMQNAMDLNEADFKKYMWVASTKIWKICNI